MTRDAFVSAATALDRMQDGRFPDLETQAAGLRETAQGVDPAVPLLDQRAAVQDFFRRAGDLLGRISGAR